MTHPAEYPSELEDHVRLPNHRLLHIRPLRTCDDGPIRELYSHLSPRTRYLRFLSPMPALPDSVLSLLTCVDYRRRLALLAELDIADGTEVVGLGSFGAIDDGTAEVGLDLARRRDHRQWHLNRFTSSCPPGWSTSPSAD
jgi:hypothetical protein